MSGAPDKRELALRRELGERTIKLNPLEKLHPQGGKTDTGLKKATDDVNALIREERLEEAKKCLRRHLQKYPSEPGLLIHAMVLEVLDRPNGSYDEAKEMGCKTMEAAIEKDSKSHIVAALSNMGIIALNEGQCQYSKMLYLAAHAIDKEALTPMQNLAGWHSRKSELEQAQVWVERILEAYPDWLKKEDIISFFKKDESLHNLRIYEPFKALVLDKVN
ncbi:MAG: hypothetical protein CO189_05755 [candidate division Zixibacteria bacterium CG_4_9_14_3_um_filter_46_8]|nr:MAG: hypothetical protein CO189_05755 [candidate division Zixibacteria bacterium CG_4_9_14_3_um_filter_46_8]